MIFTFIIFAGFKLPAHYDLKGQHTPVERFLQKKL